jgi:hypothetical protein
MKRTVFLFTFFFYFISAHAQDFGIKFSGFIKNDFIYDSRQNVTLREGNFLLYPAGKSPDADGIDLNDNPSTNFFSIQTRLTGSITAPDVLDAKLSGIIEADFFGNENAAFVDANGFRLRLAFAKLKWTNTELLLGQYWHPFFNPNCFSEVISFNTGAPVQPFSRNPQIRVVQRFGLFSLMGALATQRDFSSPGGSNSLRNAVIPDLNGQILFESRNEKSQTEFFAGAGIDYKSLRPLLSTDKGGRKFSTDETVSGLSGMAFFKVKIPALTYKIQCVYGQDLFDMTMMGGYGISSITDTNKNSVKYTPSNNISLWSEIIVTQVKNIQFGLWAGYTESLGFTDNILIYSNRVGGTDVTVRGAAPDNSSDIKSVFRISPRIVLIFNKLNFAFETEYTSAAYALKDASGKLYRDSKGKITQTENISNLRLLFSVMLKF